MTHIFGFERSQLLLLPEAIDDYVVADNPVRFIDAFVDGLDLAAAGFKRVTPKVTGRPGAESPQWLPCFLEAEVGMLIVEMIAKIRRAFFVHGKPINRDPPASPLRRATAARAALSALNARRAWRTCSPPGARGSFGSY
jgi:hypothetical protein